MMRLLASLIIWIIAATMGGGCYYAKVGRGDLAKTGLPAPATAVPLVASVAGFVNEDDGNADAAFAISKSFLTALDETRLFQGVYTEAEAPDSDVKFEGRIKDITIYENNWWLAMWGIVGVATFGIYFGLGALLGIPYATENGTIEVEIRAIERKSGTVIATYDAEWSTTAIINVYNSSDVKKQSFFLEPKRGVQHFCDEAIGRVLKDEGRYRDVATRLGAKAPEAAPKGSGDAKEAGPKAPDAPRPREAEPANEPRK